jgi:hypothetical protein
MMAPTGAKHLAYLITSIEYMLCLTVIKTTLVDGKVILKCGDITVINLKINNTSLSKCQVGADMTIQKGEGDLRALVSV